MKMNPESTLCIMHKSRSQKAEARSLMLNSLNLLSQSG